MPNAVVQNIENNKDSLINTMLNTASNQKNADIDSDGKFSNLINNINAKTEKTKSNFVDKAVKTNTSSINRFVLSNNSKKPKDLKQINFDKQPVKIENNTYSSKDNKIKDLKQVSVFNSNDESNKTTNSQVQKASSTLKEENESNLSDINNSSSVEPSPLFSSKETSEEDENTDLKKENKEILSDIVQNIIVTLDLDLSEDSQLNDKIDDLELNVESFDDAIKSIEEINELLDESDLSKQNKDDILNALNKIKNILKTSKNQLNQAQKDTIEEAKKVLDSIILKMASKNDINNTDITEAKPITQQETKDILKQNEFVSSNEESLKDLINTAKDIINKTDTALENNDFDTLKTISDNIDETIKDLTAFVKNSDETDEKAIDFNKKLIKALDDLNQTLLKDDVKPLEIKDNSDNLKDLIALNQIKDTNTPVETPLKSDDETEISSKNDITETPLKSDDENKIIKDVIKILDEYKNSIVDENLETDDIIQKLNNLLSKDETKELNTLLSNIQDEIEPLSSNVQQQLEPLISKENTKQETVKTLSNDIKTSIKETIPKQINPDFNNQKEDKNQKDFDLQEDLIQEDDIEFDDNKLSKTIEPTKETSKTADIKSLEESLKKFIKIDNLIKKVSIQNDSNKSGALTVMDEVMKLSMEDSNLNSSNLQGNVIYDVASGNGVLIKNPMSLIKASLNSSNNFQNVKSEMENFDILNQISTKMQDLKNGAQKLTMVLRPNDLGRLSIELTNNHLGLTTNIIAQNEDVRHFIEKNINTLKQKLADSGISVNSIQIKTQGQQNSSFWEGNRESFKDNSDSQNQNLNQDKNHQNNENQNGHNSKDKEKTLLSMSNYDYQFNKEFSTILNKSISYSLN